MMAETVQRDADGAAAGCMLETAADLVAGYAAYTTASSIEASRSAVAPENSPLACLCTPTAMPAELRE